MKNKIVILNIHIYKPNDEYIELTHPETRARLLLSGKNREIYLFISDNEDLNINELYQKIDHEQYTFNCDDFNNAISALENLRVLRIEEVDEW